MKGFEIFIVVDFVRLDFHDFHSILERLFGDTSKIPETKHNNI